MVARYSTVSLMREDPEVIARFISYYRGCGAEEIMIFHDGPIPCLAQLDLTGVVLRECDAAFWQGLGGRPEGLEDRQHAVYQLGLRRCRADWMLVVDADEFVFGDQSLDRFLDWVPDRVASVRLPTAEAVWGPGDNIDKPFGSTCFRTSWARVRLWKLLRRLIYGKVSPFFRHGVAGHLSGKQFLRTGRSYSLIGNHTAEQDGKAVSVWADSLGPEGQGMYVGHFDAIGYARWKQKWQRRISHDTLANRMAGTRSAQMAAVAAAFQSGEPATRRLFLRLYAVSPLQFRLLSALGYAFRRDVFGDRAWGLPA